MGWSQLGAVPSEQTRLSMICLFDPRGSLAKLSTALSANVCRGRGGMVQVTWADIRVDKSPTVLHGIRIIYTSVREFESDRSISIRHTGVITDRVVVLAMLTRRRRTVTARLVLMLDPSAFASDRTA